MENDKVNEVMDSNTTVNGTQTTPFQASTEGLALAYSSLVIMALLPIVLGSFRSLQHVRKDQKKSQEVERLSGKDAFMFPLYASCGLFGLYVVFKFFGKQYVNYLLSAYFLLIGIFAVTRILSPLKLLFPVSFPNSTHTFIYHKNEDKDNAEVLKFDNKDLVLIIASLMLGIWYITTKHWMLNNMFGIAFSINGVEMLQLGTVSTGCILLGGLFIYDVFWVFGTEVMVFVATSFEGPIKLVFPQDLIENGMFDAQKMAMLGLGDIVIPGIFIALLLRYDLYLQRKGNFYFNACFLAYAIGLGVTIFVMQYFKHAQPALLYLVPACIGTPILLATLRGDLRSMWNYNDNPDEMEKVDEAVEKKID